MGINSNIDILKKVADIERLKCQLLSNTADFFMATAEPNGNNTCSDILCILLSKVYLLAAQHGISFEELDTKTAAKLRNQILDNMFDDSDSATQNLLRHLTGRE